MKSELSREIRTADENNKKELKSLLSIKQKEDNPYVFFDLKPYSHQKEILEDLRLEREEYNSYTNLVVAVTGTGKTYVYLRTIMELNKKYGFKKFIIVVPSIAIKEGVYKSLQMTEDDFRMLYKNEPYEYFDYDSNDLEEVRNFATSNNIQIMIINIQAFNKNFTKKGLGNIFHRTNDKLSGNKPVELIWETNPIVIIDEPQSVISTNNAKKAVKSLNPLCLFRYSATHREKINLMYKLDAIDAYERKLVKQIEVASITNEDDHNTPYIKLLSVDNKKSPITAKIEIDAMKNGKYAKWFEEEYRKLLGKPKYQKLLNGEDIDEHIENSHNGYFAKDNKGRIKDSKTGNSKDDEDTYNLIMKDKEKLLSFDSKLRFIFSHSALKEGWDNPNVFQICTLNETKSTTKKRQEIGRGLRLHHQRSIKVRHVFRQNVLVLNKKVYLHL